MNLSGVDLNLLVVLEAVLEERSVTQAARRVGLSQPATSSALRRLRELLHDDLLVRSGRKLVPTSRGDQLLPTVRAALEQVRRAFDTKPAFDPATDRRTVKIVSSDYAELLLVPALMGELRKSAPGMTLQFSRPEALFLPPMEELAAGTVDLALSFVEPSPALQMSLAVEELWRETNVVIARKRHPRIRRHITRAQFLSERHAAVFYQKRGPGLIDSLLQQEGRVRSVALMLPNFVTVCNAVAATDLIATVPRRVAQKLAGPLGMQVLACPVRLPDFRFSMLWHERSTGSPPMVWLRSLISNTAQS